MNERLKTLYKQTVAPDLLDQFQYKNAYQIPKLKKIVINRGLGSQNSNALENSLSELSLIAGQKGVVTRSKKAVAAFKLRAKTPVGISIVLRGNRMYAFLELWLWRGRHCACRSPLALQHHSASTTTGAGQNQW